MAYAAVKSLVHTIRGLLSSTRISAASSTRQSLQSALDHATSLEKALDRRGGCVTETDELLIIEESHKLEDAIQFPLSTQLTQDFQLEPASTQLIQDVYCFVETATKMEAYIMTLSLPKTKMNPSPEEEGSSTSSSSSMVGLSDQFLQIRDILTDTKYREFYTFSDIIWISGMAGIGKTRLAQKLFHDPSVVASFDLRFFVRIGRDYVAYQNDEKVLQGDYHEDIEGSKFVEHVTQDRKCLIVLDDVRGELSSLYQLCHMTDNFNGSRILLTSRMDADYENHFKMRFLNEEESWELLLRKVFGEDRKEEDCPRELVKAGKKIAEECEGLPLLIITVAPILIATAQKNPEAWKRVAEKPDSVLKEAAHQISDQLLSNYHQLEEEVLKLCFLYIAAFPKKYVVWATTIAYLWYAEGFIHSWEHPTPKNYMHTLLDNNLVMGRQKGILWSVVKACRLHCAYWYVCRKEAANNKILYTINSRDDGLDECIKTHRRLAIYTNVLLAIKEVHETMASISTVRSLLCTGPYSPYQVPMCWEWKRLKVLSALTIRFYEFPIEVVQLFWLKYLGLTCNVNLPPSISKLWNLQFLIVHQHSSIKRVGVESYLPVEIWDLQELEFLQTVGRNLPDPPCSGTVLPKLKKLLDVGVESCSKRVLESLPSLKKLRVQIELGPNVGETMSCFDHLSCLDELCSLQIIVMNPTISHQHSHPHPPLTLSFYMENILSLSLSGFGYSWKDISIIAALPELKKLRLKSYAFQGEKWEVEGMSFESLLYLYIEDTDLMQWTAGEETFPRLYRLHMRNCHKLQEIPLFSTVCNGNDRGFGIKLADCNPSVETFTKQRYSTYENADVTATYSWKEEK